MSDSLEFFFKVLGRADVVGSSRKRSNHAVLRAVGTAGGISYVEVGVRGLPVDRGGLIRVDLSGWTPP